MRFNLRCDLLSICSSTEVVIFAKYDINEVEISNHTYQGRHAIRWFCVVCVLCSVCHVTVWLLLDVIITAQTFYSMVSSGYQRYYHRPSNCWWYIPCHPVYLALSALEAIFLRRCMDIYVIDRQVPKSCNEAWNYCRWKQWSLNVGIWLRTHRLVGWRQAGNMKYKMHCLCCNEIRQWAALSYICSSLCVVCVLLPVY